MGRITLLAAAGALVASAALADAPQRQSMDDAWWTGPLLAPSPNTLAPGHVYFEPYVFDVMGQGRFDASGRRQGGPESHYIGSQSYVNYGLADRLTVGLIPRFGYAEPAQGPHSSTPAFGDLTVQAQYQLTRFRPGSLVPAIGVNLQETLPTGRWDRLDRAANGIGSGDYATSLGLYSQELFWTPNGRILRVRLDLTYAFAGSAAIKDMSVYGTTQGFRGRADPGDSATADLAFEYSLTRNWVLAMDLWLQRDASTTVAGRYGGLAPTRTDTGSDKAFYAAPAVEYNFTDSVGVIVGARVEPAGRNTGATLTPVAALQYVF